MGNTGIGPAIPPGTYRDGHQMGWSSSRESANMLGCKIQAILIDPGHSSIRLIELDPENVPGSIRSALRCNAYAASQHVTSDRKGAEVLHIALGVRPAPWFNIGALERIAGRAVLVRVKNGGGYADTRIDPGKLARMIAFGE